jgi:hypothetical protein
MLHPRPFILVICLVLTSCNPTSRTDSPSTAPPSEDTSLVNGLHPISRPLITSIYTSDPSVHVFNQRIYIYPSHDLDTRIPETGEGDQFNMKDYHVFSLPRIDGEVTDHGVALQLSDIPWASRQLWGPDAAEKDGTYYLYFPAKDKEGIFRIGVAKSDKPEGPFEALDKPMKGSYSVDPSVFKDEDGTYYMYFGGLWGGQLQNWRSGHFNRTDLGPVKGEVAMGPRVAKLADNMVEFDGDVREITILDEAGIPLRAEDYDRRFFEGAWIHKFKGTYYLSYATGDTHYICYATSSSPFGPFKYRGVLLNPVLGWTTHHSTIEYNGKWYLFYHDAAMSKGIDHLRNVKVTPMEHLDDGSIKTIDPYVK